MGILPKHPIMAHRARLLSVRNECPLRAYMSEEYPWWSPEDKKSTERLRMSGFVESIPTSCSGFPPLALLCCVDLSGDLVRSAIGDGANVSETDNHLFDALHYAASIDRAECIRVLVEAGADLDTPRSYDTPLTPLMTACYQGSVKAVEVLLELGSTPYPDPLDEDDEENYHYDVEDAFEDAYTWSGVRLIYDSLFNGALSLLCCETMDEKEDDIYRIIVALTNTFEFSIWPEDIVLYAHLDPKIIRLVSQYTIGVEWCMEGVMDTYMLWVNRSHHRADAPGAIANFQKNIAYMLENNMY